jgi:hypothetical protein
MMLLLVALALSLSGYLDIARHAPPSFDGAMALNTAVSFLRGEGYGFRYTLFFPFPAQTDGPMILPAAAVIWLFGMNTPTSQAVSFIYLCCMLVVLGLIARRLAGGAEWGLLAVLLALWTPGMAGLARPVGAATGTLPALWAPEMADLAMGGYGEIPVLFFALAGIAVFGRALDDPDASAWRFLLGGIALGLCAITKTVGVLPLGIVGACFSLSLFGRRKALRSMCAAGIGAALPILGWETFRAVEIGSISGYGEWWSLQLAQVGAQSGARGTLADAPALIEKVRSHLGILGGFIGTSPGWTLCFLLAPPLVLLTRLVADRSLSRGAVFQVLALVTMAAAFFAWWLAVSPTHMAWHRRIIIGLLVQAMLATIALAWLVRLLAAGRSAGVVAPALALMLVAAPVAQLTAKGAPPTFEHRGPARSAGEMQIADAMRHLPRDAVLFGYDWWKAPVLALLSGRDIENFNQWAPEDVERLPHKYLVLDRYARAFARAGLEQIAERAELTPVLESPAGALYRIGRVKPYPDFTASERGRGDWPSWFRTAEPDWRQVRGVYREPGPFAWTQPEFAVLLGHAGENHVRLRVDVFPRLLGASTPLLLSIAPEGCAAATIELGSAWANDLLLPLDCEPRAAPRALEIRFHLNRHVPLPRQIDMDGRRLGLLLREVRLENAPR